MSETTEKIRRQTATEQLDDLITELSQRCRLDGWEAYVRELDLPIELMPALMTGRPELLMLLKPRAMTEEEVRKLYQLIGTLMETNFALQEHAQQISQQVSIWLDAFKHLNSVGRRIGHFANFRRTDAGERDA